MVDRTLLANVVLEESAALARLEAIIHPLVAASRDAFLVEAAKNGAPR